MTTLQTAPQAQTKTQEARTAQAGDLEQTRQSEQQTRDAREPAERTQSGESDNSFTVSTDDWF